MGSSSQLGSLAIEEKIKSFLFDWGPHTLDDIAKEVGITKAYASMRIQNLKSDGSVEKFRKGNQYYFLVP